VWRRFHGLDAAIYAHHWDFAAISALISFMSAGVAFWRVRRFLRQDECGAAQQSLASCVRAFVRAWFDAHRPFESGAQRPRSKEASPPGNASADGAQRFGLRALCLIFAHIFFLAAGQSMELHLWQTEGLRYDSPGQRPTAVKLTTKNKKKAGAVPASWKDAIA